MQVLIATLGTIGDIMPFLAVAEGLRERGHSVAIGSNADYAQLARGAGFEFAAIWDRSSQPLTNLTFENPQHAWDLVKQQMFIPAIQPTQDFIARFAGKEECVILASWSTFGAYKAHLALNIPICTAYLSPFAIHEGRNMPFAENSSANSIAFFPDWFAPPNANRPDGVVRTGFALFEDALVPQLPAALKDFLEEGPAPIIFTPGSFMRESAGFFNEALEVCVQLQARGVFLTPHSDQVPAKLPPDIRHFRYIALQRLSPRAAAMVHHGGIGTASQAMLAGIPQLIKPLFYDQFDNAMRIQGLGVGVMLGENHSMRNALQAILQSETTNRNCARVKAMSSRSSGVAEICRIVESIA